MLNQLIKKNSHMGIFKNKNKSKIKKIKKSKGENTDASIKVNFFRYFTAVIISSNILVITKLFEWLLNIKWMPKPITAVLSRIVKIGYGFARSTDKIANIGHTMSVASMVEIALKNMLYKRSRTFVTVAGMSVGIAAIVFLVSLGFGLQNVVVSRAINLNEMRQAEVTVQPGTNQKLDDETLSKFQDFGELDMASPVISLVARVEYSGSFSDMAVYGVTKEYLDLSAISTTNGELFTESASEVNLPDVAGVLGVSTTNSIQPPALTDDLVLERVNYTVDKDNWLHVRKGPNADSDLLGFTTQKYLNEQGYLVVGGSYVSDSGNGVVFSEGNGQKAGMWLYGEFPIWQKQKCTEDGVSCIDGIYKLVKVESGAQKVSLGYVINDGVSISSKPVSSENGDVLGASDNNDIELIELDEDEDAVIEDQVEIALDSSAKKQAVVNTAMVELLGLTPENAVGKSVKVSYVVPGGLIPGVGVKVNTVPSSYKIIGVIAEDSAPYFYVPFGDMRGLGITSYSQIRVVAKDNDSLEMLRKRIESLGFNTTSVADTKEQIDSFFATVKMVLAIVGGFALAVASLGMFNTLTVSLLERIREVGLMKSLGMSKFEVRALFLTESLLMGFYGAVIGLFFGFVVGELLSAGLSIIAIAQGYEGIHITYIPFVLTLSVLGIGFGVGLFTGMYPARKATAISALDALRYE